MAICFHNEAQACSSNLRLPCPPAPAEPVLLNASYDVMRELFKDINPAFQAE